MDILIEWVITVIIGFVVARFAVKIDVKYNASSIIDCFDEWWIISLTVLCLLVPYLNIIASIIFFIVVSFDSIGSKYFDGESAMKKLFLIKENKQKLK